jgi:hypothetical protein
MSPSIDDECGVQGTVSVSAGQCTAAGERLSAIRSRPPLKTTKARNAENGNEEVRREELFAAQLNAAR